MEVVRADYYGIDIFNGKTRALEKEIAISYIYDYPDLVFGDANGNGIAEIYVGGYYGYVHSYEWDGTTATQLWKSLDLGSYTRPCGFADADNDGNFEVFVGDSSGYLYAMDALTGTREGSVYTGYSSYTSCAIGDIDNDGTLEIATGNYDGYIRTYTYNSGTFTLEKTSVTDYGSHLGRYTDSIIISGAKDPRVFGEASFIRFSENAVSVPRDSHHNITVTFDATKLNKGNYNATIVINSNDP
ncbi:MAG: FG-GAP repeat domain-containing protein, partial [Methanosarcinales archaeon]